ncbi:hypothetical protein P872_24405 [Rhodonellum psychrophilum GCM71 = DSM 17998]|uniref:histidine kinase n=2 Tax=Rhodonellum TaxID=336827 RepID=U5C424_9BACT|nr:MULTISPECIES: substrate-binding domain-containing protein [Rhodonellum]ERM84564.1 hypothetical protein P872_24405 [Rhodonellum psychrophilum GCM71 = DSM 17998]SDY85289.1 ABC-type sugar transport system, substrate-binding protein, contains N-terminal xre family HTH domain [Rhodonellum ikkaensis]
MKKSLAKHFPMLFLQFLLIVGFCSCENPQEKKFKIGFSQCVTNDAWRKTMQEEMFRELSFYPDLSLEIKDAQGNNALQIEQILEFQRQGVDLLIVSPNESSPITPIVEEMYQSGIPVIVVDRKINSNLYSAYIGGDNYEIGITAGQYIKNLLNGKGSILEIWGLRGSSPAKERHRGLMESLEGSEIKIVSQIDGEWEKDTARIRLKEYLLQANAPGFDLVFGHNDVMTIGANEIARELNLPSKIFVGVDALPGPYGGIQAITDGVLDATFFYPTGGDKAIEVAAKILAGDSFEKENILQTAAVDASNIRIMKQQTDRIINQQSSIFRQMEMIESQLKIYKSQRGLLIVFGITLFIAIVSLAYVFKSLKDKQKINRELQRKNKEVNEQKEKVLSFSKKAEEATRYKLEFFTNISHDFRTPLTLIQGPIEELIHRKDAAPFRNDLLMVRKNTFRLLRLVNQLMDFRKIDSGKLQLKVSEQVLPPFLEEIMSVFNKSAKDNQIHFRLVCENPKIKLWFDPSMMDKVMFNLLSNAFKFTPKKGTILVNVEEDPLKHEVLITVEDTGPGMNKEETEHAFDRFYQGKSGTRITGSGLGLALSKELVELQHGTIDLKSEMGEKTVFLLRFKMGKSHFEPEELFSDLIQDQILDFESFLPEQDDSFPIENEPPDLKNTVLIIEDDLEIRNYLKNKLQTSYRILEAEDTSSAFLIALDEIPDLITCDLMLKNGNGLELIKKLKATPQTSSIPIIVISAKSSEEDMLKGIKTGIDDYITKPFSISFVMERIKTILSNRNQLKEHFLHELPRETNPLNSDKKFNKAFTSLVEENLSNPHFGVNEICKEIGLSRGQLYRKTKTVLGYSVNDYITKVRLKKAKYLLINDSGSIADISFKVGFSTAAYFSTVFKNAFGITPSEYRENQTQGKK